MLLGELLSRLRIKRKASLRSNFFKEPLSGEIPFVEQNVCLQVRFCEERTGFAAPSLQPVNLQGCQLLFSSFFLFGKEKRTSFLLFKGKNFIDLPSADKE